MEMKQMKKGLLVCLTATVILLCSACNKDKSEYYEEHLDYYSTAASYLAENYCNSDDEHVTIWMSDIATDDIQITESFDIVKERFSCAWVGENEVIFWNDELKHIGLIYTKNSKESLEDLEEWYHDVDIVKINDNWYLVGHIYNNV